MKITSQKNKKNIAILLALTLIVVGVGGYYTYTSLTPKSSKVTDTGSRVDSSKEESTADKPVASGDIPETSLPDQVNPGDIKSYTTLVENEKYKIRKLNNDYVITLYPIINNPAQYDTYQDQLKEYKREALDYMKSKGVDTTKVKITYEPNEATNL